MGWLRTDCLCSDWFVRTFCVIFTSHTICIWQVSLQNTIQSPSLFIAFMFWRFCLFYILSVGLIMHQLLANLINEVKSRTYNTATQIKCRVLKTTSVCLNLVLYYLLCLCLSTLLNENLSFFSLQMFGFETSKSPVGTIRKSNTVSVWPSKHISFCLYS